MPVIRVVEVALAVPLYQCFDYSISEREWPQLQAGCRVRVEFGRRSLVGVVVALHQRDVDPALLKPVLECLDDEPLLSSLDLQWAHWVADYYLQAIGEVVALFLPPALRKAKALIDLREPAWRICESHDVDPLEVQKRAPKQAALLAYLQAQAGQSATQAQLRLQGFSQATLKALAQKKCIQAIQLEAVSHYSAQLPDLFPAQANILQQLADTPPGFSVHLLFGDTGSGKTELYFHWLSACLARGQQALFLVPEIGLTPQFEARARQRLGDQVWLYHSGLSEKKRQRIWQQFAQGQPGLLVGTRSAVFMPMPNLAAIVIDEEHDSSYRQADGVRYQARDCAVRRAQLLSIPVLLGSATPALETLHNVDLKRYQSWRLQRQNSATQTLTIKVMDLRQQVLSAGLSQTALQRIGAHLSQQGQVLVYLNRRGFAPVLYCHDCGWSAQCPDCDARMTWYRRKQRLQCHHCGRAQKAPEQCPDCQSTQIHHYGLGTEQLERALQQQFADVPVVRIDRDAVTTAQQAEQKMQVLHQHPACILVGTEMLAKGHDYPGITLVVVVDIDQALYSTRLRASERMLQSLLQVAGRAARGTGGEVLVQTHQPDHPLMQALPKQPYEQLAAQLLQERQWLNLPPFQRIALLWAESQKSGQALTFLQRLQQQAGSAGNGWQMTPAMAASMEKRQGWYRAYVSVMASGPGVLHQQMRLLQQQLLQQKPAGGIRWFIEMDAAEQF